MSNVKVTTEIMVSKHYKGKGKIQKTFISSVAEKKAKDNQRKRMLNNQTNHKIR